MSGLIMPGDPIRRPATVTVERKADELRRFIEDGGATALVFTVAAKYGRGSNTLSFSDNLSPGDLRALAAMMRQAADHIDPRPPPPLPPPQSPPAAPYALEP